MKKNNIIYIAFSLIVATLAGCSQQEGKLNLNVQPGNELYLPADNALTDLRSGKATDFYWTPSIAHDNGYVSYDVIFATKDGNFDNPIAVVNSQFNGSRPYVSITAKALNKIARKAGIGNLEEGEVKWTVKASKGLEGSVYEEVRTLKIHTMNSMDPLPEKMFLYGPALQSAEGMETLKMTVSRGISKVAADPGIFESFCKLTAGQDFFIKDELDRHYVLNADGILAHTPQATTSRVSAGNAVVWLNIDADGMSWSQNTITKMQLYAAAWADGSMSKAEPEMTYIGNGTWKLAEYDNKTSDNSANDSRYRFNATLGDKSKLYLGTQAKLGIEYTTNYRIVELYRKEVIGNVDWDMTFNLLVQDCGKPCDVYLYLNSDNKAGTWWHDIIF